MFLSYLCNPVIFRKFCLYFNELTFHFTVVINDIKDLKTNKAGKRNIINYSNKIRFSFPSGIFNIKFEINENLLIPNFSTIKALPAFLSAVLNSKFKIRNLDIRNGMSDVRNLL